MQDNEKIITVLTDDYLQDYIEVLGIAVGIIGYYPIQADSQIRNAVTHLSRAASNPDDADRQIRKAKNHIERAKRDCLKLAIIGQRDRIEDHIKSIRYAKGGLSDEIRQRRRQASVDQKLAFLNETKGDDVNPELENVLAQLMELETELFDFDKIAYKPSKSVYYATYIVKYFYKTLSLLGMGFFVYFITKVVVPNLSAYF